MMVDNNPFALMTPEFTEKVRAFREDWYKFYKKISDEQTPQVDGSGKKVIGEKAGYDYIEDSWMSAKLTQYFPGWSWLKGGDIQVLGTEWIIADGTLEIVDEHLVAFGINPPVRRFWAAGATRITYKKGMPHTLENIVDINNDVMQAITSAKKRGINRLTGIGDDIYGKRSEIEGAGDMINFFEEQGGVSGFLGLLGQLKPKVLVSEACKILGVKELSEIEDYDEAWAKIKEAKGIK